MTQKLGARRSWYKYPWLWLFLFIMLLAAANYLAGATPACPGCCRVYF